MTPAQHKALHERLCNWRPAQVRAGVDLGPAEGAYRCCDQARSMSCVCVERIVCPVHGDKCFGSHD